MAINPRGPMKMRDDLDESYFAARSNEDGNCSRDETAADSSDEHSKSGKGNSFTANMREFKIFEKRLI